MEKAILGKCNKTAASTSGYLTLVRPDRIIITSSQVPDVKIKLESKYIFYLFIGYSRLHPASIYKLSSVT
jgi:hypothetical protein